MIHNCIHGVDINPLAAQFTKFSLWINSAQKGNKLETLGDQIKVGNSLINFDWQNNFKKIFSLKGGFDSIIGNPPYARIQTLKEYKKDELDYMKENYISAQGNFDLYTLFFEKGFSLLNDKSILTFITPNTYQTADFGKGLRIFFLKHKCLSKLVDFKQHQVFKGVSTYSCISFLNKKKNDTIDISILKYFEVHKDKIKQFKEIMNNPGLMDQSDLFETSQIKYPSTTSKWTLVGSKSKAIIDKLKKKHLRLEKLVSSIYVGLQTSADKIYVLDLLGEDKEYFIVQSQIDRSKFKIEKQAARLFYMGDDIHRYSNKPPDKVVIFPYEKDRNDKYKLIQMDKLKNNLPNTYHYLLKNRANLEKRENNKCKGSDFYRYIYPKNLDRFDYPKLLMRDISKRGQLTLDKNGGQYFTTTIYGIQLKDQSENHVYFMLSLLNSNLTWFFIKSTSTGKRGGSYRYKTKYLKPLPTLDYKEVLGSNKKAVEEIINNTKQILCDPSSQKGLNFQTRNDSLFYELYDLDREEIKHIKEKTDYKSFNT